MFRAVSLPIIRSLALYTQQYIQVMLCVQCYTPDDGQRYCPKHVESYCKNKFEKLVLLVGLIIIIIIIWYLLTRCLNNTSAFYIASTEINTTKTVQIHKSETIIIIVTILYSVRF